MAGFSQRKHKCGQGPNTKNLIGCSLLGLTETDRKLKVLSEPNDLQGRWKLGRWIGLDWFFNTGLFWNVRRSLHWIRKQLLLVFSNWLKEGSHQIIVISERRGDWRLAWYTLFSSLWGCLSVGLTRATFLAFFCPFSFLIFFGVTKLIISETCLLGLSQFFSLSFLCGDIIIGCWNDGGLDSQHLT